MGLNADNEPGIEETPHRVAKFLKEFSQPVDLVDLLKTFDADDSEVSRGGLPMVVCSRIPVAALCEHHLCPFMGEATIGYVPGRKIVGLSKMARLVNAAGHKRPTVQERLTYEIADAMDQALDPKGVMVVIRATHTCMAVRGIQTPSAVTTTSAIKGAFIHSSAARQEFFQLEEKR